MNGGKFLFIKTVWFKKKNDRIFKNSSQGLIDEDRLLFQKNFKVPRFFFQRVSRPLEKYL